MKGRESSTRGGSPWPIFWTLAVSYILVYFHRLCTAVVAVDMMNDLNAGPALMGLLAAAYFYPYAAMQLPAGLLADSIGPRRTIIIFFSIAAAGSLLIGVADTAGVAIAGRLLVGVGMAMLFVPTLKILSTWFDANRFARMTGILIAMGGLGSLAAAAPLAAVSARIGWRNSFIVVGVLTLIVTVVIALVVRDRPLHRESNNPQPSPDAVGMGRGVIMVLRYRPFWPLAAWFFFNSAIFFTFGGLWGGPYLMDVYNLDKGEAGAILSMLAAGMIVGSPLLSYVSDRLVRGRKPVLIATGAASTLVMACFAFAPGSLPLPALYLLCLGMGLFSNAVVVIGFAAAKELFPLSIAGTATGLANFFPFMGGALFQPIFGWMLELHGREGSRYSAEAYGHAFMALFACSIVSLVAACLTRESIAGRESVP